MGAESEHLRELESILTALEYLPATTEAAEERVAERQREKEVIKGRLRRLTGRLPDGGRVHPTQPGGVRRHAGRRPQLRPPRRPA